MFGSADDDCQEMKASMEELEKEIGNNENNEDLVLVISVQKIINYNGDSPIPKIEYHP